MRADAPGHENALQRRNLARVEAVLPEGNVVAESGKLAGSYCNDVACHVALKLAHIGIVRTMEAGRDGKGAPAWH